MKKDVTEQVIFGEIDGEYLPITKCVCGAHFETWEFVASIYKESPSECKYCGRKFYFSTKVIVFEVTQNEA